MNRKMIALMLALAMLFALGANAADGGGSAAQSAAAAENAAAEAETEVREDAAADAEAPAAPEPDAEGTLSFVNLRGRMLENYYPLLALEENIQTLESWDYQRTEDELRDKLNETANQQWAYLSVPGMGSMLSASLQPQYDAYREAFDQVRDGKMQADNEGVKRQLRNLQDQTVIVAESLYITYKGLEAQNSALTRTVASLKRAEKEMTLRQELGQISELTLQQVRSGAVQAESGQKTLRMNMENILLQLKAMTGVELDAAFTLGALPQVTAEQLASMDPEKDLASAQETSYELYDAKKTLDNAKDAYNDARKEYGEYSKKNEWMQAKHTWQAAQYTYENAALSFELKFRTLFAQVRDAAQVLDAKRAALTLEEKNYAASALKYEQGSISANALADAKDALADAKDAVAGAERELFTQYRSYDWAVTYGILNG